jgi:hypothetical protein
MVLFDPEGTGQASYQKAMSHIKINLLSFLLSVAMWNLCHYIGVRFIVVPSTTGNKKKISILEVVGTVGAL